MVMLLFLVYQAKGQVNYVYRESEAMDTLALGAGDLALLGFNVNTNDGNGTDEISFVSFKDISPGMYIDITDNAFQKCGTKNGWGISEGWIRITRTHATLNAGNVITLRVTHGTATVVAPDTNWNAIKPQPSGQGLFELNPQGEQIFFFSGGIVGGPGWATPASDEGTYTLGKMLFGFNSLGNVWKPVCGSAAAGGTQNSDKPLQFDCFLAWPAIHADFDKYTGSRSAATANAWMLRITNPVNWTGYADNSKYNSTSANNPNYRDSMGVGRGFQLSVLSARVDAEQVSLSNLACSDPLPIALFNFTTASNGKTVEVNWSTFSEVNSDYFLLERSQNGKQFEQGIKIKGGGNSNELLHYHQTDELPFMGTSYYRLSQVDYDGQERELGISVVKVHELPSPLNINYLFVDQNNRLLSIALTQPDQVKLELELIDLLGRVLYHTRVDCSVPFTMSTATIPPGIYTMRINNDREVLTRKLRL